MKSDEVIAVLAEAIPGLVPVTPTAAERLWESAPIAGNRARAAVRVGARWISIEATLPRDRNMDASRTLHLQSTLPGGVKVVQRRAELGLRAEIPVLVETAPAREWLRRQAAMVYAGVRAALGRTNGALRFAEEKGIEFDPIELAERCTTGGRHASVRADAEVRVEFDSRSAHRCINLSQHGNAIRAAVTLETGALAEQCPDTQSALGVFLLRATRSLRWVRAFATGSADTIEAVGFECIFAPPSDDQPVIMALDALVTACELYGGEAETLAESAELARHYLALDEGAFKRPAIPADRVPTGSAPAPGAVTEVVIA